MNNSQTPNLGEAARRFLASLTPEEGKTSQQEIYRFVRWYGWERSLASLAAAEVANYAERLSSSDSDYAGKLDLIRAFLACAKKEGWTKSNLATHLKIKKGRNKSQPLTRRGKSQATSLSQQKYDELKAELEALKDKRAQAIDEMGRAAADKDFRENAPLEAAREQHGQIVGRIRELEEVLKSAVLLEGKPKATKAVSIGNSVVLQDMASKEKLRYKIVSPREINPSQGKISNVSPLGKAIIGQEEGQIIEVATPAGKIRYQIKLIEA